MCFKTLWNQGRNDMKEIEKGLPNNGCGNTPQSILSNKLEHEKC